MVPTARDSGRHRWIAVVLVSVALTAGIAAIYWPGAMSFDSLFAYQEARTGVVSAAWPPLHSYVFAATNAAGIGPGGVLIAQVLAIFVGAGLVFAAFCATTRSVVLSLIAFAVGLLVYPTLIGSLVVLWRDTLTAALGLAGVGLWAVAGQRRSWAFVIAAGISLAATTALRFNAIALVGPALMLLVWRPFIASSTPPPKSVRVVVAVSVAATLLLSWASMHWRLWDLAELPAVNPLSATQEFDLIGIGACAGRDMLPASASSEPVSAEQLRSIYDPRGFLVTLQPRQAVPQIYWLEADPATPAHWQPPPGPPAMPVLRAAWVAAISAEPRCYLIHRAKVLAIQFGVAPEGAFYPTHVGIDPNPYGLSENFAGRVAQNLSATPAGLPRQPIMLWLWSFPVAIVGAVISRRTRPVVAALLLGAVGYSASLILSPEAVGRYLFPASVFCLTAGVLGAGAVLAHYLIPISPSASKVRDVPAPAPPTRKSATSSVSCPYQSR